MYDIILLSRVWAITERSEMGLYEEPMCMPVLAFRTGIMFANFHVCGIMLLFNAVLSMLLIYASQRGHICFRCLMFNFSGPVEVFFFCVLFFLDLSCCECNVM